MERTLDIIVPLEEKQKPKRKTNCGTLANYYNKGKLSETGKEPTSNIKKTTTGRHLLESETDTTEC